jgi:glycosyltransferase involved in cell wall biosynthesis
VPGTEVVSFISEADVSVMPIRDVCLSYRYCLPNKLFESAHAAVPVVASALPDMAAFIAEYSIGTVVDGEDPAAWAEAIRDVYLQRASFYTRERIDRIRRESSAENEVAKVSALYRRVLAESLALPF